MKKTVDSVAIMRKAREKLSAEWAGKSRVEEIRRLREKHAQHIAGKSATTSQS